MLAGLALAAAVAMDLPARLESGRFFYTPQVAGRMLRLWLDTDGSGFVTRSLVDELGLPTAGAKARLPDGVLQPLAGDGFLPIVRPDAGDAILADLSGQLGATWFQGRIVQLDYPRGRLRVLDAPPAESGRLGKAALSAGLYRSVAVTVGGRRYTMSFDTAATVALDDAAAKVLHDGWSRVRATSFVRGDLLRAWHANYPQWQYIERAGDPGVSLIRVPSLRIGTYRASDVWFSTRPGDDVFEGESVAGKIGPTAFSSVSVCLDYPGGVVTFDP